METDETETDPLTEMNCGMFRLDPDRRITTVNPAVARWTGSRVDQIVGRDLGSLLARGSLVYWETAVEPLLQTQGYAWDLALEIRTGGGSFAVLTNARRTGDATQSLMFPFSQRRRYERKIRAAQSHAILQKAEIQRLEKIEAFRREFINKAAHELSTPLTPILLQFHLLKGALGDPVDPTVNQALRIIKTNLDSLFRLSSSLMVAADIQAARLDIQNGPVDLERTLPDIIASWKQGQKTQHVIETDIHKGIIQADEKALTTCLHQLLDNARKFSPPGSTIRIQTEPGPPIRIMVIDSGRGIEPGRLEELGRPFAQLHDPNELTMLGPGLGLHIVTELMKAQGGSLVVHSQGRGKGTQAVLEFPPPETNTGQEPSPQESETPRPQREETFSRLWNTNAPRR